MEAGAGDAEDTFGHGGESCWGDRLAARVAAPVGALVELGERTVYACERALRGAADPDIGEAFDRLGRPVADALAESLGGAELGDGGQRGEAPGQGFAAVTQHGADGVLVGCVFGGHRAGVPGVGAGRRWGPGRRPRTRCATGRSAADPQAPPDDSGGAFVVR